MLGDDAFEALLDAGAERVEPRRPAKAPAKAPVKAPPAKACSADPASQRPPCRPSKAAAALSHAAAWVRSLPDGRRKPAAAPVPTPTPAPAPRRPWLHPRRLARLRHRSPRRPAPAAPAPAPSLRRSRCAARGACRAADLSLAPPPASAAFASYCRPTLGMTPASKASAARKAWIPILLLAIRGWRRDLLVRAASTACQARRRGCWHCRRWRRCRRSRRRGRQASRLPARPTRRRTPKLAKTELPDVGAR